MGGDGLFEAVLADPSVSEDGGAGDALRLVYADWLEEHGDAARAEFIRVQVRLERMPEGDPARGDLMERAAYLEDLHRPAWEKPVRDAVRCTGEFTAFFRRGFIETVWLPAVTFLEQADALFATAPVRSLRLFEVSVPFARLAASPLLARLRGLDLSDSTVGRAGLDDLAASPHLDGLRSLDLASNLLTADDLNALAGPGLAGVHDLSLGGNSFGDEGVDTLIRLGLLGRLHALDLWNTQTTAQGVRRLAREVDGLTRLRLDGTDLGREGVAAIADAPGLGRLTRLELAWCHLPSVAVHELVNSPYLSRVEYLALGGNPIGDRGAKSLAGWRRLSQLRLLFLNRTGLSAAGVEALATSGGLAGVTSLWLSENDLRGGGAAALAGCHDLPLLHTLSLSRARIGEAGAIALAGADHLTALRHLYLQQNGIDDVGAAAFAASPLTQHLTWLDLSGNLIGDAGARALTAAAWPKLRRLELSDNNISEATAAKLRERFGARIEI
jgi:uncharacterized protein (TIGR02996 family)